MFIQNIISILKDIEIGQIVLWNQSVDLKLPKMTSNQFLATLNTDRESE